MLGEKTPAVNLGKYIVTFYIDVARQMALSSLPVGTFLQGNVVPRALSQPSTLRRRTDHEEDVNKQSGGCNSVARAGSSHQLNTFISIAASGWRFSEAHLMTRCFRKWRTAPALGCQNTTLNFVSRRWVLSTRTGFIEPLACCAVNCGWV